MLELIFILVFGACVLVTGLTAFGVLAATGVALVVLMVLSMLGLALKWLPWIIVIAFGIWLYRRHQHVPR